MRLARTALVVIQGAGAERHRRGLATAHRQGLQCAVKRPAPQVSTSHWRLGPETRRPIRSWSLESAGLDVQWRRRFQPRPRRLLQAVVMKLQRSSTSVRPVRKALLSPCPPLTTTSKS